MIRRLLDRTNFAEAVDGGELTAVKIHFGERGVTSHVQPLRSRDCSLARPDSAVTATSPVQPSRPR